MWFIIFLLLDVLPDRLNYATDYSGSTFLRPYMLAWRADAGCSGYIEPEIALTLIELVCVEGLRAYHVEHIHSQQNISLRLHTVVHSERHSTI